MEKTILTPDGRELRVEEGGDPAGHPVLVHNGAPSSRHLYGAHLAAAVERGIRLISYDRPGYGGSTPKPGRSVVDCVADVRTIAAALGIERLAIWGFSYGGPYALACAAQLPDLVTAVAVLASPAPYGAPGLDYGSEAIREDVDREAKLMREDPDTARAEFVTAREAALAQSPQALLDSWKSTATLGEAPALSLDLAEYRVKTYRSGLALSEEGWWEDEDAWIHPWGFDLETITVPVLLCHGRRDQSVPVGHGLWLAEHLPSVEVRLSDDGHLSLFVRGMDVAKEWLLAHFGRVVDTERSIPHRSSG
jgi:pimeloyl-ACP methyl ester carboxylesterase